MSILTDYSALIFDIGDVLFSWSSHTRTSISPKTLQKILSTPTWFEYECGRISQDVCYERIGSQFSIAPNEVERAFNDARDSLQCDEEMISLIRELKIQSPSLRVFAMSNISIPDYQYLRTKPADWSIFDQVFTSGAAGDRKPNLGFYKQVIANTGIDPSKAIFVDDKPENVLSARSLGFCGIVFDNAKKVGRSLRNLVGDPVKRGRQYLKTKAGSHDSVTDGNITIQENFAQLLILELTEDRYVSCQFLHVKYLMASYRSLVHLVEHPRTWNFFQGWSPLSEVFLCSDIFVARTTIVDNGEIPCRP
jgi:FMN phosphatase YigB (HAD superfamily)